MSKPKPLSKPVCARCGAESAGLASAGAEPQQGKAVLGFPSCMDCREPLNDLLTKLIVVLVTADNKWVVMPYAQTGGVQPGVPRLDA